MLFNSIDFAIFLPIVFGLYWFITNKNYLEFLDLNQYSKLILTCRKLDSDYENVRYTNFNDYTDFITDDFKDSDHLNARGAKKLSVIVNKL